MDAGWRKRVKELFLAACERRPELRSEYLDDACGDDPELRREVESLLIEHGRQGAEAVPILEPSSTSTEPAGEPSSDPRLGSTIGRYRIVGVVGKGGMGTVYEAEDPDLGRAVALKILPPAVAGDPKRLERFKREARSVAALSHPNVVTLYSVEEEDNIHFLTMELVHGEPLDRLIPEHGLDLGEILNRATQLAEGLRAAHEQGIIHRDLKPANLIVDTEGRLRILDFGLAKTQPDRPDGSQAETSLELTVRGTVLGTAPYMSPEQVEGKPLDARSDIFSFGSILYEMATGRWPFPGETLAAVTAAVLRDEPTPLTRLRSDLPEGVQRIVDRCLAKEPAKRYQSARELRDALAAMQPVVSSASLPRATKDSRTRLPDIGAARLELQDVLAGSTLDPETATADEDASGATAVRRLARQRWAWAASLLVTAGLAGFLAIVLLTQTTEARPAVHFIFDPPENLTLSDANPLAVSPDGGSIVFAGRTPAGVEQLWTRTLDVLEVRALPGTEGGGQPFWSPDGSSIAFFAEGELRKLSLAGGTVQRICALPLAVFTPAGTWNNEGNIVFSTGRRRGLYSVSATGGVARPLTTPDEQTHHWWPQFLPDGRRFLFEIYSAQAEKKGVHVASLDAPDEWRRLLPTPMRSRYGSGHLLFVQDGSTLLAQPFDAVRAELTGEPVAVASSVASGKVPRWGWFSVSASGALTYLEGNTNIQLVWLDRAGKRLGTLGDPESYHGPIALSPDDSRVAVQIMAGDGQHDIWVVDVARGITNRVTTGPPQAQDPVWSPDGRELMFRGGPDGGDPYRIELRAGATASSLFETAAREFPEDWSRDGKILLYSTFGEESAFWALPLDGDGSPELVLKTGASLREPQMSPDGRWLAYMSDESERYEVYVEPFRRPGERVRVSPEGGSQPKWRGDGKELFYLSPDRQLMAVDFREGVSGPDVGMPKVLVPAGKAMVLGWGRDDYAVTADGQRFLVKTRVEEDDRRIHVLLNWTSLLE